MKEIELNMNDVVNSINKEMNDITNLNSIPNDSAVPSCDNDISDDDFEDDSPCGMDGLTLPNSNTDRSKCEKLTSNCNLCPYQATRGWKQLTKHYVRLHPGEKVSTSRLSSAYNARELAENPILPLVTKVSGETMIQSLCYICNEGYNMSSSKWLMHFISHTGKSRIA